MREMGVNINFIRRHHYDDLKTKHQKLLIEAQELVKALEFMTMPLTYRHHTVESLLETMGEDVLRGKQALARWKEAMK